MFDFNKNIPFLFDSNDNEPLLDCLKLFSSNIYEINLGFNNLFYKSVFLNKKQILAIKELLNQGKSPYDCAQSVSPFFNFLNYSLISINSEFIKDKKLKKIILISNVFAWINSKPSISTSENFLLLFTSLITYMSSNYDKMFIFLIQIVIYKSFELQLFEISTNDILILCNFLINFQDTNQKNSIYLLIQLLIYCNEIGDILIIKSIIKTLSFLISLNKNIINEINFNLLLEFCLSSLNTLNLDIIHLISILSDLDSNNILFTIYGELPSIINLKLLSLNNNKLLENKLNKTLIILKNDYPFDFNIFRSKINKFEYQLPKFIDISLNPEDFFSNNQLEILGLIQPLININNSDYIQAFLSVFISIISKNIHSNHFYDLIIFFISLLKTIPEILCFQFFDFIFINSTIFNPEITFFNNEINLLFKTRQFIIENILHYFPNQIYSLLILINQSNLCLFVEILYRIHDKFPQYFLNNDSFISLLIDTLTTLFYHFILNDSKLSFQVWDTLFKIINIFLYLYFNLLFFFQNYNFLNNYLSYFFQDFYKLNIIKNIERYFLLMNSSMKINFLINYFHNLFLT